MRTAAFLLVLVALPLAGASHLSGTPGWYDGVVVGEGVVQEYRGQETYFCSAVVHVAVVYDNVTRTARVVGGACAGTLEFQGCGTYTNPYHVPSHASLWCRSDDGLVAKELTLGWYGEFRVRIVEQAPFWDIYTGMDGVLVATGTETSDLADRGHNV